MREMSLKRLPNDLAAVLIEQHRAYKLPLGYLVLYVPARKFPEIIKALGNRFPEFCNHFLSQRHFKEKNLKLGLLLHIKIN